MTLPSSPFAAEERALVRGQVLERNQLLSLQGWFPVALADDPPGLWWRHLGSKRLSEPFFRDTLVAQEPEQRLCCRTELADLDTIKPGLAPTALIFHTSRCGSTLFTQLLSTLPHCIVASEPPVIDSFLRFHRADPAASGGTATLGGLVRALGQQREDEERHFFVKLDSWHIHDLPLFRQAFPATPFIFLYRQPDEILASHRRKRGPQMIPGLLGNLPPVDIGNPEPIAPGDLEGHAAQVVAGFLKSAIHHAAELTLVDYQQLPAVLWTRLLPDLGVSLNAPEIAELQARARRHSKHPGQDFAGDPPTTPTAADFPAVARLYGELEQQRHDRERFQPAPAPLAG